MSDTTKPAEEFIKVVSLPKGRFASYWKNPENGLPIKDWLELHYKAAALTAKGQDTTPYTDVMAKIKSAEDRTKQNNWPMAGYRPNA